MAGVYGNRTHCERLSHPPLVLKTRAGTSRANTPEGLALGAKGFAILALTRRGVYHRRPNHHPAEGITAPRHEPKPIRVKPSRSQ
jgi:hypothetical protein